MAAPPLSRRLRGADLLYRLFVTDLIRSSWPWYLLAPKRRLRRRLVLARHDRCGGLKLPGARAFRALDPDADLKVVGDVAVVAAIEVIVRIRKEAPVLHASEVDLTVLRLSQIRA